MQGDNRENVQDKVAKPEDGPQAYQGGSRWERLTPTLM